MALRGSKPRIYSEIGQYRTGPNKEYSEVAVVYDATKTQATKLGKEKYGKDIIVKKIYPHVSYYSVFARR